MHVVGTMISQQPVLHSYCCQQISHLKTFCRAETNVDPSMNIAVFMPATAVLCNPFLLTVTLCILLCQSYLAHTPRW